MKILLSVLLLVSCGIMISQMREIKEMSYHIVDIANNSQESGDYLSTARKGQWMIISIFTQAIGLIGGICLLISFIQLGKSKGKKEGE